MPGRTTSAILLLTALLACDDGTSPDDDTVSGSASVLLYVDQDSSATPTAGDWMVGGEKVRLTSSTGLEQVAHTDGAGVAHFSGLPRAVWRASLVEPVHCAHFGSDSTAQLKPVSGSAATAELRLEPSGGIVDGTLYRDSNGNGSYDRHVDTPLTGVLVRLIRTSDTAHVVATTTTAGHDHYNRGSYQFDSVYPGTYRLFAPPQTALAGTHLLSAPVRVENCSTARHDVKLDGTAVLLQSITAMRKAGVGSRVAFDGVVTVPPEAFLAAGVERHVYVQDPTEGIRVTTLPPTLHLAVGDSVRIIGTLGSLDTEAQVSTSTITLLGTGSAPMPLQLSAGEMSTLAHKGRLVGVDGIRVLRVSPVDPSSGAYSVTFQRFLPTDTFQVHIANSQIGVPQSQWVPDRYYDVDGIVGVRHGVVQLKPRSAAEVRGGDPDVTVAATRQRAPGDTLSIVGVVHSRVDGFEPRIYVQDGTGALGVVGFGNGVAGDSVRVHGVLTTYRGELLIGDAVEGGVPSPDVERLGRGTVPAPLRITAAQLAGAGFDARLVQLENLQVTGIGPRDNRTLQYEVRLVGTDGAVVILWMHHDSGLAPTFWEVGQRYGLTGIAITQGTLRLRSAADVMR